MNLQTSIPFIKNSNNLIDYNSKVLLLGSCFSENIGNQFKYFKFQSIQNPFGILFHPKAIEHILLNAVNEKEYSGRDLIVQNELFHSFDAHSSLSADNENAVLNNLNFGIKTLKKELKKASHIIITLGTSWVYRYIETNEIVANCHKIPQKEFLKELLSVDEIKKSLDAIYSIIKSENANAHLIFTVSPVRHLKNGFVENMQSKAHLITAIHPLLKQKDVSYFSAYEIMMDELRDYRFYGEDMIHPNNTAIRYIWERFTTTWFSEETLESMSEIETIQKGIAHKPFNKNSVQHQQFLKQLASKKQKVMKELPFIKF